MKYYVLRLSLWFLIPLQDSSSISEESQKRAIRRQSEDLRKDEKYSYAGILHAAMMVLKEQGHDNAHKILKRIIDNPVIGDQLMDSVKNPAPQPVQKLSRVEALSFVIHHDWSENDYNQTKKKSKQCNADFLPCYNYISDEKKLCRPPRDQYFITEYVATIPLKALLLHSIDRILEIPWVIQRFLELKETATEALDLLFESKIGNDT